jgi:hypothetical protein
MVLATRFGETIRIAPARIEPLGPWAFTDVVPPAFASMKIEAVATKYGETRSLSYVSSAGFEPASPFRHLCRKGALTRRTSVW